MMKRTVMINNDLVSLDSDFYLYLLKQEEILKKIYIGLKKYSNKDHFICVDEILEKFFNCENLEYGNSIIKNSTLDEMLEKKGRNYVLTMYVNRYIHMTQKQLNYVLSYERRNVL